MIGIVKSSLPGGREMQPFRPCMRRRSSGLQGLLFNSLSGAQPDVGRGRTARGARGGEPAAPASLGQFGVVNPVLPFRGEQIARAGGGDLEAGVRRLVNCAAEIAIHDLFFVIGMIEDRFHADVAWQAQRDVLAALVLRCAPLLARHAFAPPSQDARGITTREVVSLVETVGPELIGVAFDPRECGCAGWKIRCGRAPGRTLCRAGACRRCRRALPGRRHPAFPRAAR